MIAQISLLWLVTVALLVAPAQSCRHIDIFSEALGNQRFSQIPLDAHRSASGRASYIAEADDRKVYLYHITLDDPSRAVGRWVINDLLDSKDQAIAFVNSWSVSPHLVNEAVGNHVPWQYSTEGEWVDEPTLEVVCADEDDGIVFFESSPLHIDAVGFYVPRVLSEQATVAHPESVYSFIKTDPRSPDFFLFRLNDDTWMVGESYGVDAGLAFVKDSAASAHLVNNTEWHFTDLANNNSWTVDNSELYHPSRVDRQDSSLDLASIYATVRFARSLKFIPLGQRYVTMRNDAPIPQIGLGTGGIAYEETATVIEQALRIGYRFLDLAREYGNEHLIPGVFSKLGDESPELPVRRDVFLQSKVWPTMLGVIPTLDALASALHDMQTTYLDAFLLHWPRCDEAVEWMHCEDTVDPAGTWQGSWTALEKAYAEGLVNSIGVSNFDVSLLDELASFSAVLPHIVQNYAAPGEMDYDVRDWAIDHNVVYQPYASGRNLQTLDGDIKETIKELAQLHNQSEYAIVHKMFLSTGAVTIPRSSKPDHLRQNLEMFGDWELTKAEMLRLGWGVDPADLHDAGEVGEGVDL